MNDYTDIGYDENMCKVNSIPNRNLGTVLPSIDNQDRYVVRTGKFKSSATGNNAFIGISNISTAAGTVGANQYAFVNTTIDPINAPNSDQYLNFGVPFIAIYEGVSAVGSMIIYPSVGNGISTGKFQCHSGFNYASGLWTGVNSVWTVTVQNTAGSTANLYVETQWKYTNHGIPNSQ